MIFLIIKNKINELKSFSQLILLKSLCELGKTTDYHPIVLSFESISFMCLKHYIIYQNDYKRLSDENDIVVFKGIHQIKNELENKGVYFNDYEGFLRIYKNEVRSRFNFISETYIIELIKKDLNELLLDEEMNNLIKYSNGEEKVGLTTNFLTSVNKNFQEIIEMLNSEINILDFSSNHSRPVYNSLTEVLRIMYNDEDSGILAMARIHLIGIAYGDEISNLTPKERRKIINEATGKPSLLTELNKGIGLKDLVEIKDKTIIPILKGSIYDV